MLSALVCTRNRPHAIGQVVASLLDGEDATRELELIVIDQSDDDASERALAGRVADARLRYVRSSARGKGKALNEGLGRARGEIVVCTDDDCAAPAGWISGMSRVLETRPDVALVFCNVRPAPYDRGAGYIPAYEFEQSRLISRIGETRRGHGLGAGMAVRRSVLLALGGFDEAVGPGSRFPSGDDWDIEHRLLLKGFHVYEAAELAVVHDGFRTFAEGRAHTRRDWLAIGAVCAKPLRAGYLEALPMAAWVFGKDALLPPLRDLARGRRPSGFVRIVAFAQGFAHALLTPVDREKLLFRET
jgi:glycosyltransferase involved in cell wall biosynthesis